MEESVHHKSKPGGNAAEEEQAEGGYQHGHDEDRPRDPDVHVPDSWPRTGPVPHQLASAERKARQSVGLAAIAIGPADGLLNPLFASVMASGRQHDFEQLRIRSKFLEHPLDVAQAPQSW